MNPNSHETDKPKLPIDILEEGLNYVITAGSQPTESDPEILESLKALGIATGPSAEDISYVTSVMQSVLPKVEYISEKIQEHANPDAELAKQSERYIRVIEASKTIFEGISQVVSIPEASSTASTANSAVQPKRVRPSGKRRATIRLSNEALLNEKEQTRVVEVITYKPTNRDYRTNMINTFRDGKATDRKRSSEDGVYLRKAIDKTIKSLHESSDEGIITKKMLTEALVPKSYPNYRSMRKKVRVFLSNHFFGGPEHVDQAKREKFVIKVGEKESSSKNQESSYQTKPEYLYKLSQSYADELGVDLK